MAGTVVRESVTLAGLAERAAVARVFVGAVLAGYPGRDVAVLLASELFGIGVRHSRSGAPGGTVTVAVEARNGLVRVEVTDKGGLGVPESPRALSGHMEDALRMSDLARSLGWSQSRLSHAMAWLRKSGWVRRIPCPTDKRSSLAQLTAKGRQKLTEAAPGHVAAVRHLVFDALTGEQQRILAQISAAITAHGDTPTP